MTENSEVNQVYKLISDTLEITQESLAQNGNSDQHEEWDSMGHLSILVALDKHFNGKISGISDLAEADSVEKIIKILKENSII